MRILACLLLIAGCGKVVTGDRCTTAAECSDPAAPFCIDRECQATCVSETDCTDPDRGVCAADGACVGCETNDQCAAGAPICDATDRACRGCTEDSECTGGVCIEADGTCVADADAAFVTMMGTDSGTCTRTAPCATIEFAVGKLAGRQVIHVLGGSLFLTATVALSGTLVLDGEDTTLQVGGSIATLSVSGPADVAIEGFRIAAPTSDTVAGIEVKGPTARVVFDGMTIDGNGAIAIRGVNSSDLVLQRSHIGGLGPTSSNVVRCENSKLRVDRSVFENSVISDNNIVCEATVLRTRFESAHDGSVQMFSGQLVMENNLVIHRDGFNDSIVAVNLRPGSTIRFNTIVNTTALPSDGAALSCDNTVEVTSNIFAYNSGHPITGQGCATRFSVFDDVSTTAAGTGNQVTGIDTIFVDRGAGDYHLSAASVARENAEPGQTMVDVDFEGSPRPNPAGSVSDCGAFEAP